MRVSIAVADNIVTVDGVANRSDCSALASESKSAVQWYGDNGEVEFAGHVRPNEKITNFSPYQVYVDQAEPLAPPPPAVNPTLDSFAPKSMNDILTGD
jgi:hypothetical protein